MLLLLVMASFSVGVTLSKYITTKSVDQSQIGVARWAVQINSSDIVAQGTTLNAAFKKVTNANVADGAIAPSSTYYADFEIDPTGTDVAIDYSFTIGTLELKTGNAAVTTPVNSRFIVKQVCYVGSDGAVGNNVTRPSDTVHKYIGSVDLPDGTDGKKTAMTAAQKVKVRIYVEWTDVSVEGSENNNADDTTVGAGAASATAGAEYNLMVPITIVVEQKTAATTPTQT